MIPCPFSRTSSRLDPRAPAPGHGRRKEPHRDDPERPSGHRPADRPCRAARPPRPCCTTTCRWTRRSPRPWWPAGAPPAGCWTAPTTGCWSSSAPARSTTRPPRSSTPAGWPRRADRLAGDLLVVMRVYFEKPRTTVGWKGLINDPDLDGSFQINDGLRCRPRAPARRHRARPAGGLRVPRPDHAAVHRRPGGWGAIGARTTESQIHRQLASRPVHARSASRTAPTAMSRSPSTRCRRPARPIFPGIDDDGRAAIITTTRQRGRPRGPARRERPGRTTTRSRRRRARPAAPRPGCPSA